MDHPDHHWYLRSTTHDSTGPGKLIHPYPPIPTHTHPYPPIPTHTHPYHRIKSIKIIYSVNHLTIPIATESTMSYPHTNCSKIMYTWCTQPPKERIIMARVTVCVSGGSEIDKDASTIGELKAQMGVGNMLASVNGEPKADDYTLGQFDFVTFTQQVKGARACTPVLPTGMKLPLIWQCRF